jgi:hypothetical protein
VIREMMEYSRATRGEISLENPIKNGKLIDDDQQSGVNNVPYAAYPGMNLIDQIDLDVLPRRKS